MFDVSVCYRKSSVIDMMHCIRRRNPWTEDGQSQRSNCTCSDLQNVDVALVRVCINCQGGTMLLMHQHGVPLCLEGVHVVKAKRRY
jgi:hypothetical protein